MPDLTPGRDTWRDLGAVGAATTSVGGSLASVAAGVCCVPVIAPLIVGLLGAGGAATAAGWKPYTGILLLVSGGLLGLSFRLVYAQRSTCPVNATPSLRQRWMPRITKTVLWTGAGLWATAVVTRVLLG